MIGRLTFSVFVVLCFILAVHCEESLQSLIDAIKNPTLSSEQKKAAYQALEKRATSDYSVKEMLKRDVLKSLYAPLKEEYGNALEKEQALSVLSKIVAHSTDTCENILTSGIIQLFGRLIKRGSVDVQQHIITIIKHLILPPKNRGQVFAAEGLLDGIVFALRTGTPVTREKTAGLVLQLVALLEVKDKLIALEVVPHLQKVATIGTATARKHAISALTKLGEEIPAEALAAQNIPDPTPPQQTIEMNKNSNLHAHAHAVTFDIGQPEPEDVSQNWWRSSIKQTRKIAKTNNKLRKPSRFRHI